LIFGKINSSEKLLISFVNSVEDLPPYDDYDMSNRTYRYFDGDYLFPFRFGLSYSRI